MLTTKALLERVCDYYAAYPAEYPVGAVTPEHFAPQLIRILDTYGLDCLSRKHMAGHITTSALILSHDLRRFLVVYHNKLQIWVAPGGHHEGDPSLEDSAAREGVEETGVRGRLVLTEPSIFDIDSHQIPANEAKGEDTHVHHDFLFLFVASPDATIAADLTEVAEAKWVDIAEMSEFKSRTASRWQRLSAKLQPLLAAADGDAGKFLALPIEGAGYVAHKAQGGTWHDILAAAVLEPEDAIRLEEMRERQGMAEGIILRPEKSIIDPFAPAIKPFEELPVSAANGIFIFQTPEGRFGVVESTMSEMPAIIPELLAGTLEHAPKLSLFSATDDAMKEALVLQRGYIDRGDILEYGIVDWSADNYGALMAGHIGTY